MDTGALFEPKALWGSTSGRQARVCGGAGRGAALLVAAVVPGAAGEAEPAAAIFGSFDGAVGRAEGCGWGNASTLEEDRAASAGA